MTTSSRAAEDSSKPAFVVGVTGHMDLDPARRDLVKAEVKRIFTWLRVPSRDRDKNISETSLGPGLDLKNTPIILLSSLAPGADQWVAEAALEMDPPLKVLAPLPFFKDQYLKASTFIRNGATINQAASRFLVEFPDPDVFVVRLPDEIGMDDEALRAKLKTILTGQEGKQARDRRYAAAGEYVAAYSDILIALTDKPIGQAENVASIPSGGQGARAVAELKRRGVTPGLLPILPTLHWADNGPVIHLYAPRKTEQAAGSRNNERSAKVKSLEVLYPYDCRPPGVSEQDNDNPEWQKAGYSLLKIVSEHLQRLNTEEIHVDLEREEGAFLEMLPAPPDSSGRSARTHALPTASEHLQATLDRIARLRRRIADYSTYYNAHLTRLKRALFVLAFASALFFALADNWDGKNIGLPLPQAFFVTALGLTLAAWIVYFCFKKTGAADRCEDYRAIAEGLRVQFYWTACGSGESVASSYLQRQRGELAWIRNVISVTAFPFEPNRVRFNLLSSEDQLAALQSIRKTWIGGQCAYFKKTTSDLDLRRELFSTYARVLLWAGFILFTFFFFFAQGPNPTGSPRLFGLLSFTAGALILAMLYRESITSAGQGAKNEKTEREQSDRTPEEFVDEIQKWLRSFPDKLLPERIRSRKGGHLILNSLLVIAFSLIAIGMVNLLEGLAPWLPSPYKFGSIFKYLALAGGVLCGAWVEVNFFSEHIRHYASMASLFQAAGLRLDDYFNWAGQSAAAGQDEAEKQIIANIQGLMVAVGREALAENAEWLITHRARPLEPVSV